MFFTLQIFYKKNSFEIEEFAENYDGETMEKAGIESDMVSPKLLPDYAKKF